MGYRSPDSFSHSFAPDAEMPGAEKTTVFKLMEEARRRPITVGDTVEDPERQVIEDLLKGIETVRVGESDAVSIDGPAGYVPLEITPENVEAVAAELDLLAPPYVTDILYGQPNPDFGDTPINASVRQSETGRDA